jgi:flagellar biosynthesis protein FlhA
MEALTKFALLTIGNGLVSQIPSLMVSVASGILVTRSASEKNFGTDLSQQLFAFPKVMMVTAAVMLILGIVPGFPTIPFFLLAAGCGAGAWLLNKDEKEKERMEQAAAVEEAKPEAVEEPEDYMAFTQVEMLEVEIGYGLISLPMKAAGGSAGADFRYQKAMCP